MKIYDCSMFFNETMIYEVRLNVLNDYVDKFVIVESLYTHSGEKKKQNFNIDNYSKFKDKIIYILLEDKPEVPFKIDENSTDKVGHERMNSLKRIEKQYNALSKGIKDADNNDLIILSDCDEIPNLKNLSNIKINNEIILFKQKIFYYKFNLLHNSMEWFGSKACKKKRLITFDWLRYIKNKKYPFWRIETLFSKNKYINVKIINDGGWHFSKIKDENDIFYTLSNYGEHNEFNRSGITKEKIKELIDNQELYFDHTLDKTGKEKYSSRIKLDKVDNSNLPKYLTNNLEKYKKWFA